MIKRWFWALILALLALPLHAQFDEDELLPPEQAFAFSARAVDAATIEAVWDVAEGYYLYRSRIRLESDTPGVSLGEPDFPTGKKKQDEFFGEVEIYRNQLRVQLPVERGGAEAMNLALVGHSQGCADIGVCYPPQRQTVSLELPAGAAAAKTSPLQELVALGDSLGAGADDEFLEPDAAFVFSSDPEGSDHLQLRWDIAPDYYLYRERMKFAVVEGDLALGEPSFPTGEIKEDEFFGRMEVYHDTLQVQLPITSGREGRVAVTYQGCAEAGICYPPQTKTVALNLTSGVGAAAPTAAAASATSAPISEQDRIAQRLAEGSVLLIIASFFGFGLLLAFTPCVFPMIPILSSIIVGQGEKITTRRAFVLSLTYVLAMAVTYTAAGVVAGMFGENLQAAFQNPWILGSFAAVFVLLSLSMFGFYDLQMPQSVQSRLTEFSNRQAGGTLFGVAIMGFLSALIVGPCVAAPLAGALIYIGQSGDPLLGGLALFALSLGMGTPLVMIGTGAGKLLPKAGGWMNTVKGVFGVLLLAVAIWMLERILPPAVTLALWAVLLIVSSIYLGALDSLAPDATGWHRFWKGTGLAMLVYGVLLLVGAAAGGQDMLQPLRGLTLAQATPGQAVAAAPHAQFRKVANSAELDAALQEASAKGQGALLDFYADWCVDCKKLEKYTFSHPEVQQALSDTLLLQADVTANNGDDKALLKRFGLIGPPGIVFFDPSGDELRRYRLVGYLSPEEFMGHLTQLPR